jgi:hypothetical protein
MTTVPSTKPSWLDTQAEVVTCKYESGAGQVLAFGIPTSKHFLITFTYYAHGKAYTDEFTSPTYLEQGATFSVAYNPLTPQENSKSVSTRTTRTPLFAIGIAGSVILSLIWLTLMRGCN